MELPKLKIGNLVAKIPIIQGGMGVGISLSNLAGNVALNGGIGVLSGVEIGFNEPDYYKNKKEANLRALKYHIKRAKEISKGGIIGINIMTVLNNFEEIVVESVREKIDIIFSGAGLPLTLPSFTKGTDTKVVPIVSSDRAATLICKTWDKRYNVIPDAIVLEGPKAGGHLGFSREELEDSSKELDSLLLEVLEAVKPFEEKYCKKIPIIAGGGVTTGKDIAELINQGASGVQIGSRFAATIECDACDSFKETYVNAREEDIVLINSPVGLIGRAINNKFIEDAKDGLRRPIKCITNCLKPCKPTEVDYCIANALINGQKGNLSSGFVFAGANSYKIKNIISVKDLIRELVDEAKLYIN
ncbi:nitronate monooxygenase family protein [Tissierella sp. MB52-C2]|uniref:NAD(P)H-dependent flavin oxidoreductase n=1 Tax=Tissierella sp. MB52-C2 TaxID=3070999 RepID=UPI00280BC454|nr:nitronate monooxygenase family protein [Tissierella sp. MB52-C2]WMM25000.1 nitronate monooxygenase family protein [Tissierella sp. MB52-C2]